MMRLIIEGDSTTIARAEKLLKAFKVSVVQDSDLSLESITLENEHLKKTIEELEAKAAEVKTDSVEAAEVPTIDEGTKASKKPSGKSKK